MQEELSQALQEARAQGANAIAAFFDTLHRNPDDRLVSEFLLDVLAGIRPTDGALLPMRAASELARRRRVEFLPRFKAIFATLPGLPGLRDYRKSVAEAITLLENTASGQLCNCRAYAEAASAPYQSDIKIVREQVGEHHSITQITALCGICGKQWLIEVDDSYHYPIARWQTP